MAFPQRLTRAASDIPFAQRVELIANGAITENDIVIVDGRVGGLMRAARADADAVLTARGRLWVALSSQVTGAKFEGVPWRFVRNVNTAAWAAIGDVVFMSGAAGAVSAAAGVFGVQVGEVMEVSATTGAYILDPNSAYGSAAGGAAAGTGGLTWTINDDGAAGTNEDPALILEGGDGGAELISTLLQQDSSLDRIYLWTSDTVDGTTDRTTYLTIGPSGNAQAVGNDIDSRIDLRAHVAAAAVATWITASIVLDAGANDLDIFVSDTATDIDIDAGTATGAVNIDAGGAISIDAMAASNFTVTGAFDLTVASTLGSIVVQGGEAVVDAIQLTATNAAGGLDLNAGTGGVTVDTTDGGPISIDAIGAPSNITLTATLAADDLTISVAGAVDASLMLLSSGTGADAVRIQASAVAGGIDVDAGTSGIAIDTTGALSLDAAAASNLTVTGAFNLTITSTAGGVDISSGEAAVDAIHLNATNAAGGIELDAGTGGIAIDTLDGGGISIDAIGQPSNITLTANLAADDLTISVAGAVDASLMLLSSGTAADALRLQASAVTGGIDVDAGTGGIDIATTGALSIDFSGAASNISLAATGDTQDLTIAVTGAFNASLFLTSTGTGADAIRVNASAGGLDIDAAGAINITAADGQIVTVEGGDGTAQLQISGAGAVSLDSEAGQVLTLLGRAGVTVTSTGGTLLLDGTGQTVDLNSTALDIDASGLVTLDGTLGISIDGSGAASNFSSTSQDLTIATLTAGTLLVSSAGALTVTAATTSVWSLAGTNAGALTLTIDANNAGAGDGVLTLAAKTTVNIGDAGNPAIAHPGSGAVTYAGNPTINFGTGAITLGGTALTTNASLVWTLLDNNGSALSIDAAGTAGLLAINTMNGAEIVSTSGVLTTLDRVVGGTARRVGGMISTHADTSASITSTAGVDAETVFSNGTTTIPANTFKAGTTVHVRAMVRVSDGATAESLQCRMRLGGVGGSLLGSTNGVDVATADQAIFDIFLESHGAPGAAVEIAWSGTVTVFAALEAAVTLRLAAGTLNFATNGALDLVMTAQWTGANAGDDVELEQFSVLAYG